MTTMVGIEHAVVTLNGHTINGWANEGVAIEFPAEPTAEVTHSPDGKMMVVANGLRGGSITFRVMPTSVSAAWFAKKYQRRLNGIYDKYDGSSVDPQTNASATLTNGYFISGPMGQNMGTEFAAREYVMVFEQIKENLDAVEFTQAPPLNAG